MSLPDTPWDQGALALDLLAVDPAGLGGIIVRARSGPVRDTLLDGLTHLAQPLNRIHPALADETLFGGLDLSATLASGQIVHEQGLLNRPGTLVLTMAERCPPSLAARLSGALDTGRCLVALDEGCDEDEGAPAALVERCAFRVDLTDTAISTRPASGTRPAEISAARTRLSKISVPPDLLAQLATATVQLGIDSARAAQFALRAARALAALSGKTEVDVDILAQACAMTMAHRATVLPTEDNATEDPPPNEPDQDQDQPQQSGDETVSLPDELLIEAIRALLPADLLARIAGRSARLGKGSGTGAARKGNRRGRPLPARAGRLGNGARIDIVATLRSAAPWQRIRAASAPQQDRLHIRPADIRLKRFEEKSDRLLIFAVDASGSAAVARLAEAKGAVELLLAQAYARRDHVCLISFRGTGAELLLAPTRSLVQTKRRLAGLPGGGGTPLAAGLKAAYEQVAQARRRGLTPTIAILTDGRANIGLDGLPDRAKAAQDAITIAAHLRAAGADTIVIDTGNRPEPALRDLAATLGGTYLPLPRADAKRLSQAVSAALDA